MKYVLERHISSKVVNGGIGVLAFWSIICAVILLFAHIFPRLCGAQENTMQLVKYPRILSTPNKVYLCNEISSTDCLHRCKYPY